MRNSSQVKPISFLKANAAERSNSTRSAADSRIIQPGANASSSGQCQFFETALSGV